MSVFNVVAHSHCMGPGRGQEPGNDGLLYYTMSVHTTQGQGQAHGIIVFYYTHPVPGPGPGPV